MGKWVEVARKDDIAPDSATCVQVGDLRIALYRIGEDEFYATDDVCSHDEASLSEGWFADRYIIECPRHGARFDVRTGKVVRMPAAYPVRTFPIRIDGDRIFVEVNEEEVDG
ncbi:MAG: non-heme iron oxygenase ferredoxin subunit [Armatimonadetes bacterium]|nr:non-heme iron oxygenase ferredoxin subunit [Armatimonadota bacterium]MDW8120813.1 non-heme iron oxygenase ferredoxin subunit [Armatimonadota bacterium]